MKRITAIITALVMLISAFPITISAEGGVVFEGDDKIVILIDPGHGGPNVGTAANGIGEKVKTLELGLKLKALLEANGNFVVHMTRSSEIGYDMEIAERGIKANEVNADLIVSLHFDGSTNTGDRGISVITSIMPEYTMSTLGNMIGQKLSAATGLSYKGLLLRKDTEGYYWNSEFQWDCQDPSLGVLSDYYGIPTWGVKFGIRSVLIEHGYFTNPGDRSIIFTDGMMDTMAQADADAIIEYYTNHTHQYESAPRRDFPSNCTFTGKQSVHCTVCQHRKDITYLEAAPNRHYWVDKYTHPVKCGEDGYTYRECRITTNLEEKGVECDIHKETVYTKAEPHDYVVTASAKKTHTTDGYSTYTCSKCKETYTVYEYAEGHTWTLSEEVAPTCTAYGIKKYTCSGCDEVKEENTSPLGHSEYYTSHTPATCTEKGRKEGYCTACNADISGDIEPTGHSFTEEVTKEASCTESGLIKKTCTACSLTEEIEISPTGHTDNGLGVCALCAEAIETEAVTEPETTAETEAETKKEKPSESETDAESSKNSLPGFEHLPTGVLIAVLLALAAAVAIIIVIIVRRRQTDSASDTEEKSSEEAEEALREESSEEATEETPAEESSEETAEAETEEVPEEAKE